MTLEDDTRSAVERSARDSYGRLLAFLASRSRDVAAAEDALADAFRIALETWPDSGVPEQPDAWLLTAARRRLLDAARHVQVQKQAVPTLAALADEAQSLANARALPDDRLKVMFICAHPALNAAASTPLMLQTVLGLDAARIAAAFLVKPSAMGQRLTRAKAKIRDAGIRFDLPAPGELPGRLDAVLGAIYAAYGSGWEDLAGADPRRRGLAKEAIDLGRLLYRLMPDEPEVQGLLALMLHCEARRQARRTVDSRYVPLAEQDVTLWSVPMMAEAEQLLLAASRARRIGRFQLEAAIQSVHARRARTGRTDWEAVLLLYEGLVSLAPTIGALVGRAAVAAEARGAEVGWTLLQAVPSNAVVSYQSYWAVAGHLLHARGRLHEARLAYTRAIGLSQDAAVRSFLLEQMQHGT